MADTLDVPYDHHAETWVVGCALGSHSGYRQAVEAGVRPDHFYRPNHARLYRACGTAPDAPSILHEPQRVAHIAAAAHVPYSTAWALAEGRPAHRPGARLLARLTATAELRDAMRLAGDIYNLIGAGSDMATIDQAVTDLNRHLDDAAIHLRHTAA